MSPLIPSLVLTLGLTLSVGCGRKEPPAEAESATTSSQSGNSRSLAETPPAPTPQPGPDTGSDASTTDTLVTGPEGASDASSPGILESVDQARRRLEAGEFDTAAAELLKLQLASSQFSEQEASAYRDALSDTMSAAVTAADKGDSRAEAALQMLRATRRRP